MARNLDMTALRSFAMVAETGGVTRAAARLHLTQSAVSMQVKRLEEAIGAPLIDRSRRGMALSPQGELLLSYARRMIALNDEAWGRLTADDLEGEIVFGVPADIVYPHVPGVLRRFARAFPRMKVTLVSSYTRRLKAMLRAGEADLILTTESDPDAGAELLQRADLVWVGAPGGHAWTARPLRLAFENNCIFRSAAQEALDDAGIEWEMGVTSETTRSIEAFLSADLGVHASLEGAVSPFLEKIDHGGALPPMPRVGINMYVAEAANPQALSLADQVRDAYAGVESTIAAPDAKLAAE